MKKGDQVRALRALVGLRKDRHANAPDGQNWVAAGRLGKIVRVSNKGRSLGVPPHYICEFDEGFLTYSNLQDIGPLHALEQLAKQAE